MANLSYHEKNTLEELLDMPTGYVMDFSNNSFARFIKEVINIEIYSDPGYEEYTSKANKIRQIWDKESDYTVGILIEALLSYFEDMQLRNNKLTEYERNKIAEMREVAYRLKEKSSTIELPNCEEETLQTLLEDIKNALARNKPALVLDRLHTFSTKRLRKICEDNDIKVTDNKGNNLPLHSLAGMLKKKYENEEIFQSSFTLLAIQNSISLFDRYNGIRNDQSYAHDNTILDSLEAEFAVRIIADLILFLDKVEDFRKSETEEVLDFVDDFEVPF